MFRPYRVYGQAQEAPAVTPRASNMLEKAVGKRAAAIQANPQSFVYGVQAAPSWAEPTLQSGNLWRQRMTEAMQTNSWERGIQSVGTEGWRTATIEKAANWQTGSLAPSAQAKYRNNFAPIVNAIEGALPTLPPRGPPMSEQNFERARGVWSAVHNASVAMKGAAPVGQYYPTQQQAKAQSQYARREYPPYGTTYPYERRTQYPYPVYGK